LDVAEGFRGGSERTRERGDIDANLWKPAGDRRKSQVKNAASEEKEKRAEAETPSHGGLCSTEKGQKSYSYFDITLE